MSAVVHGSLMAGVTMTAHASPFFEGGDGKHSEYRSAILALQMVVSTALLPLVTGLTRMPDLLTFILAQALAIAISIAWGLLRVSWLDVVLLWLWNLVGHAVIGLVGKRLL